MVEKTERKIVINNCYGGFGLSHAGTMAYARYKGITLFAYRDKSINGKYLLYEEGEDEPFFINYTTKKIVTKEELNEFYWSEDIKRDDPALIKTIEDLGERANSRVADLKIVSIPIDVKWEIGEYDGIEWVAEEHRTWS